MAEPGITDKDGAALAYTDGAAAVESCAGNCPGGCGACPWYWRARACGIPGCVVFVCSDAACKAGGPNGGQVTPGMVFASGGLCWLVEVGGKKWVKNPGDGSPPPEGEAYLPADAVLVDGPVECFGSCAQCPPPACEPGPKNLCVPISVPWPFYEFKAGGKILCPGSKIDCCGDLSGSVEYAGTAGEWQYVPNGGGATYLGRDWKWAGTVTAEADGQGGWVNHIVFTLTRTSYYPPGDPHQPTVDVFDVDQKFGYDNQHCPDLDAVSYGFSPSGPSDGSGTCLSGVGCGGGHIAVRMYFHDGQLAKTFSESYTVKGGIGNCAAKCPGKSLGSEEPGRNDPGSFGGFGGQQHGQLRFCERCGGVAAGEWCGCGNRLCSGCG